MKSLMRRLPSARTRTQVVIPEWLGEYASAWREQGAAAVVLFGSRALGFALSDSDWDVAVVFHDSQQVEIAKTEVNLADSIPPGHEVNPVVDSIDELPLSLAREIKKGISIVGDFNSMYVEPDQITMQLTNKTDLNNHVVYAFYNAVYGLHHAQYEWAYSGGNHDLAILKSSLVSAHSADAAARSVKALCCLLEISYDHTQNVAKLAEKIPAEWHSLVLRMNGTTGEQHVTLYEEDPGESVHNGVVRISYVMELIDLILKDPRYPTDAETLASLRSRIGKSTIDEWRTLHEPSTHPECTRITRGLLAILDSDGTLAQEWGIE